ncbi:MAG: FKBP-type peptidyl-prolyl cis-trans isomerase [Chitinophagales bacterium]
MIFKNLLFSLLIVAALVSSCNGKGGSAATALKTSQDSLAYSLGVDYAASLEGAEIKGLNTDAFSKALNDVLAGKELEVSETEVAQQVRDFVSKMRSPEATPEDKNISDEKIAYAFGIDYGKNLQKSGLTDFNTAAFENAVKTSMAGDKTKLMIAAEDATALIQKEFSALQAKKGAENKVKGEEFLTANKAREGVTTTDSGLQYEIITEGTGPIPTAEDNVKVHYHGTLIDGKVFDSSVDRGEPASFPVGGVIRGWVEALQLMPVGSKWKLFIPADLAYGERGAGGDIGPNEALVFEVELLEIVKPEAPEDTEK